MGIPKFFRWLRYLQSLCLSSNGATGSNRPHYSSCECSERYPLCSQLVTENRLSEFGKKKPPILNRKFHSNSSLFSSDNLYLDMNGIIHHCSHPNDDSLVIISEEKIFLGVFNYIEQLFQVIGPKKVFFMAIDGLRLPPFPSWNPLVIEISPPLPLNMKALPPGPR